MYNGIALALSLAFAGLCYWWGYNHGRMNGFFDGHERGRAKYKDFEDRYADDAFDRYREVSWELDQLRD